MIAKFFQNKNRNYVLVTQLINAIIALVLGKLIALYILPEDFGTYNLYFATYTFFATLLISPTIQFIKSANQTTLPKLGSRYFIYTLIGAMCISYLLLVSFLYIYYDKVDALLLLIFFLFIPLATTNNIIIDFLNVKGELVNFSIANVLKAFSGLVFIGLYFYLDKPFVNDVQIIWLMQMLSSALFIIFFSKYYTVYKTKFKVSYKAFFKKYFRFALPLVFLALWSWINGYFDRFAIDHYLRTQDVGVYNASYGVGAKFFVLLSPVFMTILTPKVYANAKKSVKKEIITKYMGYYVLIAIIMLLGIYYTKDYIGGLLLSSNYKEGFFLIFWVALAFAIINLTYLLELYFYAESKTKIILIANIASAIINIVMNIILIPLMGLLGAAIATCIGFTLHFTIIYFNFRRI